MAETSCVVLIPVVTLVVIRRVRLFRMRCVEDQLTLRIGDTQLALWMEPDFGAFLQRIMPSLAAAFVAECGMTALAAGNPVSAGVLLGVAVVVPAWRWPMADRVGRKGRWSVEAALAAVLMLIAANWAARPKVGGSETREPLAPLTTAKGMSREGGDLSGVILTMPIRPREKVLPPPPIKRGGQVAAVRRPLKIQFDGVYWYFKAPDRQPRRDARVMQGDPSRSKIRSTNAIPIQMEAHQRLPEFTSMNDYQEISVRMSDADNVQGLIRVSLLLQGEKGTDPLLLGTRVLEASRTRLGYESRPAVEEELLFVVTPMARKKDWREIVVRVEPEQARAQAGAHVAVLDFSLNP